MEQERLLSLIDKAIDLYQACQPIKGMLPHATKIYSILRTCGLKVEMEQIRRCREIVIDRRAGRLELSTIPSETEENDLHSGECIDCGRYSSRLSLNNLCEGCVMQAMIDAQSA